MSRKQQNYSSWPEIIHNPPSRLVFSYPIIIVIWCSSQDIHPLNRAPDIYHSKFPHHNPIIKSLSDVIIIIMISMTQVHWSYFIFVNKTYGNFLTSLYYEKNEDDVISWSSLLFWSPCIRWQHDGIFYTVLSFKMGNLILSKEEYYFLS